MGFSVLSGSAMVPTCKKISIAQRTKDLLHSEHEEHKKITYRCLRSHDQEWTAVGEMPGGPKDAPACGLVRYSNGDEAVVIASSAEVDIYDLTTGSWRTSSNALGITGAVAVPYGNTFITVGESERYIAVPARLDSSITFNLYIKRFPNSGADVAPIMLRI